MIGLGALSFTTPWLLAALLALPILWMVLRVTPPQPRKIAFPGTRLLADLLRTEETPVRLPWWLLALRLLLIALVIVGLAGPLFNAQPVSIDGGRLLLVVDNGWSSGPDWAARRSAAEARIDEARRAGMSVIVLPTAPGFQELPVPSLEAPGEAKRTVAGLSPMPWAPRRADALARVLPVIETSSGEGRLAVAWIADGLAHDGDAETFAAALARLGPVERIGRETARTRVAMLPPESSGSDVRVRLIRAEAGAPLDTRIRLLAAQGRTLATTDVAFAPGAMTGEGTLTLPIELRNEARRIELDIGRSTAGVQLLDDRWRRRVAGVISVESGETGQPLLSSTYYVERALQPDTELRLGTLSDLVTSDVSLIVAPDIGQILAEDRESVVRWIEGGGTLVRFAGPRLANQADDLLPVTLRQGGRTLGGALSWETPQRLAPFDPTSPFSGIAVPDDVTISRQVLAEPTLDLPERTWARLGDGTPLVTAQSRGAGRIILFHVTANADWSTLPLSGLFVEMLRRVVTTSKGVEAGAVAAGEEAGAAALAPTRLLTAEGRLVPAAPTVRPIAANRLLGETPPAASPETPAGYYGRSDRLVALNFARPDTRLAALPPEPAGLRDSLLDSRSAAIDLRPWLFVPALLILLADMILTLWLSGRLARLLPHRRARAAAALLAVGAGLALAGIGSGPALAQDATTEQALAATLTTRLAYVITGDSTSDRIAEAGLTGLSQALRIRTAVEPGAPIGIDLERDDLALFPFLYWRVTSGQAQPTSEAIAKLDTFMKTGGMILFDTADQANRIGGGSDAFSTPEQKRLREVLTSLDVPPLEPVPSAHVLTKSFYLLQDFPGRYNSGRVWIEATPKDEARSGAAEHNDGVSPLVIGSNDWAGAWAVDSNGRALFPLVPGSPRQREYALRFGINLVMYTLTGNYKADQVHVPALLERLGQ